MKTMYKFAALLAVLASGMTYVACSDECDYLDTNTSNPVMGDGIKHPRYLLEFDTLVIVKNVLVDPLSVASDTAVFDTVPSFDLSYRFDVPADLSASYVVDTTYFSDSLFVPIPVKWVRGAGMKFNAYGEEIQGFVESMDFFCADSVIVKMSEGCTAGTWVDDSNTESTPCYEYTYSASSGTVKVLKRVTNEKGAVSKTEIFTAVANIGKKNVMTVVHYGDTPVQSYLVKE